MSKLNLNIDNETTQQIKNSFTENKFVSLECILDPYLFNYVSLSSIYDININRKQNTLCSLTDSELDDKYFHGKVDSIYDSVCSRALQAFVNDAFNTLVDNNLIMTYSRLHSYNGVFEKKNPKRNTEISFFISLDWPITFNISTPTVNNEKVTLSRGGILILDNKNSIYKTADPKAAAVSFITCNYVDHNDPSNEPYLFDGDKNKGMIITI